MIIYIPTLYPLISLLSAFHTHHIHSFVLFFPFPFFFGTFKHTPLVPSRSIPSPQSIMHFTAPKAALALFCLASCSSAFALPAVFRNRAVETCWDVKEGIGCTASGPQLGCSLNRWDIVCRSICHSPLSLSHTHTHSLSVILPKYV